MKKQKGVTLIELVIGIFIVCIFLTIVSRIFTGIPLIPNKQQCINSGGKWSEGIQFGEITQLCTYN